MNTKIWKRSTALLLALAMCLSGLLGMGFPNAFAAEAAEAEVYLVAFPRDGDENRDAAWGHPALNYKNGWSTKESSYTLVRGIGSYEGNVCYCIEPGVPQETGDRFAQRDESFWENLPADFNDQLTGQEVKVLLGRILHYGYTGTISLDWRSQREADADKLAHLLATQLLIWETVVGERDSNFNHITPPEAYNAIGEAVPEDHPLHDRVFAYYGSIAASVQAHATLPSFLSPTENAAESIDLEWDGTQYTAVLTDTSGVLDNFSFSAGNPEVHFSVDGNTLTITAQTAPQEPVTITGERVNTQRRGVITWTDGIYDPNSGTQDVVTYAQEIDETIRGYGKLHVSKGRAKLVKTSEDGNVEGIPFRITGNDVDETVTTGADGTVEMDLLPGVYTVTELADDRYEPQPPQAVTIASGETAAVTFHNTLKRGSLKVTKTAEDGLVEGVKFHLFGTSNAGIPVDEFAVTDSSGIAAFEDILLGHDYVLEEVDTAIRYVLPDSKTAAVEWGTVTENRFENILKKWSATVTKVDAETGTAQGGASLAGATYGVFQGEDLVDTYTTNEHGQFTTRDYACGSDWTIREIAPSEGYLLDETVYPVGAAPELYDLEYNPISLVVTEQVIRGNVQLTKVDKDYPDNKLAGAVFDVYQDWNGNGELDKDDVLLGQMQELSDGIYQMNDLTYGSYLVKEIKAPTGFYLDTNTYAFSINENGVTVVVENEAGKGFINAAQTGSVRIEKTSEDGVLKGFTFRVTGSDITGQVFSKEYVTDENGEIHIEGLRVGDYVISEVSNEATEKYEMPPDVTVTVLEGKTTVAKFHNKRIPKIPDVPKTGDTTNTGLWAALALVSLAGAVVCARVGIRIKKK